MNSLDITIDGVKYEYVYSIKEDGKCYIAYSDDSNIYISEYKLTNDDKLELYDINDDTSNKIAKLMELV